MRLIGSEEYARKHKLTRRAAQMAAEAGIVPAHKVSGVWLFDDIEDPPRRSPGRPLTPGSAARLKAALRMGVEAVPMNDQQRFRVHYFIKRLREAENMAGLLRGWFRDFEKPALYRIPRSNVANVMGNQYFSFTGFAVSDEKLLEKYPLQAYVESGADAVLGFNDVVIAGTKREPRKDDRRDIWIQQASNGAFEKPVSPSTVAIDVSRLSGTEVDAAVLKHLGPRLDELLATQRRRRGRRAASAN